MSRARSAAALAVLLALGHSGCTGARRAVPATPPVERRSFELAGGGALELSVPAGWTVAATESTPNVPVAVRLETPGAAERVLISALWGPGEPDEVPGRPDTAHLLAEMARRNALAGAVEREIPLEELSGDGAHGFWFSATDRELEGREPGPGEYRHVLQGAAAVGPLVLAFALLDQGPGPHRAQVLEMIRGARHVAGRDVRAPRELELDPGANTVPLRVAGRGRSWSVLVDLPGFRVFKPRRDGGEDDVLVVGQEPRTGIVASVILRAAGEARDAAGCREADLERIRGGVSTLRDLRLWSAAEAARATYGVDGPPDAPTRQVHAHAWLFRDGACAAVHVSKIEPEPGDEERLERILASVRFGEEL